MLAALYVDPLFKPIVLFQDINREQENLSHTVDTETTDDFSPLLSKSLQQEQLWFVLLFKL